MKGCETERGGDVLIPNIGSKGGKLRTIEGKGQDRKSRRMLYTMGCPLGGIGKEGLARLREAQRDTV